MFCIYCGNKESDIMFTQCSYCGNPANIQPIQSTSKQSYDFLDKLNISPYDRQELIDLLENKIFNYETLKTLTNNFTDVDTFLGTNQNIQCLFCEKELSKYSSLNDGGTIICSHCDKWFHPATKNTPAHAYNGTGPLNCKTCYPDK